VKLRDRGAPGRLSRLAPTVAGKRGVIMAGRIVSALLVFVVGLAGAGRLQAQETAPVLGEAEIATAPVELDGMVLFRVRGVTSLPAATRARLIRDRIEAVAADRTIPIDSLRVVESENGARIVAGDQTILAVVAADANLEQVSVPVLAGTTLSRVRQAIGDYRAARSPSAIRRAAVNTLLATLMLAAAISALLWLFRRVDTVLTRRLQAHIHTVGIQSFEVMRADRIWAAVRSGFLVLRTVALFAGALVYVGYVLGQWPWTRGAARGLVGFVLGPLEVIGRGIVANIPSAIFLVVLFVVVRFALKLIRLFFEAIGRGSVVLAGFDAEWAQPTYKIIRVVIVAFGLIVAYPYIPGSESAAFKGVSLFIGIIFSLGSSSAISNIIAGYMMTYRRAFKIGDRVKIGDAVGDVVEMRLQVTHLRSYKNEEIVIPNSQILTTEVLNYSSLARTQGLILHTEVGIGYETPWRQVEAMLIGAAGRTPGLEQEPRPFVLLKKLGDFAVIYELNGYCRDVKAMNALYTALHRNILDVFNEYGVQIMTPAYEGDPAEPKVVPPAHWYAAPAAFPAEHVSSTES
jgi:small-conductance mechanosensitive channel